MAARWIGLLRPSHQSFAAPRVCPKRTLQDTLRGLGASGVLATAVVFTCAANPEAYAQTLAAIERPISFFVAEPQFAPIPADVAALSMAPREIDEADVRLLAATAWGEARSEGEHGMRAVAHVMVNRVGERFGQSLRSVILAPAQFSAWNRGDPNRPLVQNPERYATGGENLATWEAAQRVAREVLSGQSIDPTGGSLFYHTTAIRPYWSRYGEGRQVIGAHVFYRDVPDQRPRTRVTRVTQTYDPPIAIEPAQGAHAGRVRGVIQIAPAAVAEQVDTRLEELARAQAQAREQGITQ